MNLEKLKDVLAKVDLACNDQIPQGATLAWSDPKKGNLPWSDLKTVLVFAVNALEPKKVNIIKDKAEDATI